MKLDFETIKATLFALALSAGATAGAALPSPNDNLRTVTNGWFIMGDASDNNIADAPKHRVFVSDFQMDQNLITHDNWELVYQYAVQNGYIFGTNAGVAFPGPNQPVQSVSWYDAAKWCNARSQMEGLTPCYYADAAKTVVYTAGNLNLTTSNVKWDVNGYRLPTEAEWEKAARGTLATNRFPWGMTISQSKACYQSPLVLASAYDLGPGGVAPTSTKSVGSYQPNGLGFYDMAGNLEEWCWDVYSGTYYGTPASTNNPTGPASGSTRVARGGQWNLYANSCRSASRQKFAAVSASRYIGFRCVQGGGTSQPPPGQQVQHVYFDPSTVTDLISGSTNSIVAYSDVGLPVALSISNSALASIVNNGGSASLRVGVGTITVAAHANAGTANGTNYASADATMVFNVNPGNSVGAAVTLEQVLGSPTNIVDQAALNTVLAHYWLQSPPYIAGAAFPGRTNLSFTITNFMFTVQCSTNLSTWQTLQSQAKIVFDDISALNAPSRYYRLVGTTNY